jgi:hypothetical protein
MRNEPEVKKLRGKAVWVDHPEDTFWKVRGSALRLRAVSPGKHYLIKT